MGVREGGRDRGKDGGRERGKDGGRERGRGWEEREEVGEGEEVGRL